MAYKLPNVNFVALPVPDITGGIQQCDLH